MCICACAHTHAHIAHKHSPTFSFIISLLFFNNSLNLAHSEFALPNRQHHEIFKPEYLCLPAMIMLPWGPTQLSGRAQFPQKNVRKPTTRDGSCGEGGRGKGSSPVPTLKEWWYISQISTTSAWLIKINRVCHNQPVAPAGGVDEAVGEGEAHTGS